MRKTVLISILALLLLSGLWWLKNWWTVGRFVESTNNAYTQADIAIISAKVAGIVGKVNVSNNEQVQAGDILISLEKEAFEVRLANASAAVASARAALVGVENRQLLQDATISANQAEVRTAQAELERTRLDLVRAEKLKSRGFAEQQRYDYALTDVASAEAELARTQANLIAARSQRKVLGAESDEKDAELLEAQAEQRLKEIALGLSDIRAPRSGVVGNKHVEPGEHIRVGARKMALVSLDKIWITANMKETQLTNIEPGQSASVTVDAYEDELISGSVASISPASGAQFSLLPADNATGNFTKIVQRVPVKIVLDQSHPLIKRLRPGMSVSVSIDTLSKPDTEVAASH